MWKLESHECFHSVAFEIEFGAEASGFASPKSQSWCRLPLWIGLRIVGYTLDVFIWETRLVSSRGRKPELGI